MSTLSLDLRLRFFLFDLYPTMPSSSIAEQCRGALDSITSTTSTDQQAMNEVAWNALHQIYVKYIRKGMETPLEVNISHRRRLNVTTAFEQSRADKGIDEVLVSIERCVEDVSLLLNNSHHRFADESERFMEVTIKLAELQRASTPQPEQSYSNSTPL